MNFKFPVAKVGVDSSDGEIRSSVDIPLHEDGDFPKEQLQMAIGATLNMAEQVRDAIAEAYSEASAADVSRPPMPPELAALLDHPDAGSSVPPDSDPPNYKEDGGQSEAA